MQRTLQKQAAVEQAADASARVTSPVFLVGAERSGTTLTRLMLDHHPQIAWVNEFEYAVEWVPEAEGWPNLSAYYEWLETHRIFQATGLAVDRRLSYPELVNDFLVQWRRRAGKPAIGATVHRGFDRLLRIWPDARFIHIVRDPRDVARSRVQMGWAGNVYHANQTWLETERLWARLREQIPEAQRIELCYETLVAWPEEQLRRLCRFIGVDFSPAMLDYHRDTTYEPLDPSLLEQWRRKLSDRQVQLIEADAAELMTERGYELSGLPRLRITPAARLHLAWTNRWNRFRFRFHRLGPRLWLSDFLSRRLGLRSWQKRIRLQLNELDRQYLQ